MIPHAFPIIFPIIFSVTRVVIVSLHDETRVVQLVKFSTQLVKFRYERSNSQLATGKFSATGSWQLATLTSNWCIFVQLATGNWQLATGEIEIHD